MVNSKIKSVENNAIVLDDESKIPFDILIWIAGVRANKLTDAMTEIKLQKGFCVEADKSLKILLFANVFGIGDITYCVDESTGKSMPMTAMVALGQANVVAKNIRNSILKKPLKTYRPSYSGFIIPLGGRYGIIESHGFHIAGIIPWIAKRLVAFHYWYGIIGFKKAFSLAKNGIKIFIRNDKLII